MSHPIQYICIVALGCHSLHENTHVNFSDQITREMTANKKLFWSFATTIEYFYFNFLLLPNVCFIKIRTKHNSTYYTTVFSQNFNETDISMD